MNSKYNDMAKDFILTFTAIFYEALPFIVLGVWIAGILQEYLPQSLVARVMPRRRGLSIFIGGMLGLIFPMCDCGIIPIMRRLLRKGLPLSCCISYLLAGPIINPVVILSTLAAFRGNASHGNMQMDAWLITSLRIGMGYLVAVVTALIVERLHQKYGDDLLKPSLRPGNLPIVDDEEATAARDPFSKRLSRISETALHDFIEITAFLIIGALLAATAKVLISVETITQLSTAQPLLVIAIMMVYAIAVTLCSEADAFIAASFSTMRPAAKLAFMVLGPMLDFKLILMYMRVFRPRLIWTIIFAIVLQIFLYSAIIHYLWEYLQSPTPTAGI